MYIILNNSNQLTYEQTLISSLSDHRRHRVVP
jgi:hypothetical protein